MATETKALAGLEPRAFWDRFEQLTKIARPSRHEEPVIEWVRAWGSERGYDVRQDAARNLVQAGQHRCSGDTTGKGSGGRSTSGLVFGYLAHCHFL